MLIFILAMTEIIMKSFQTALVLTLLLAVGADLQAEARPASHSGTSSSFKSGFSSQKSNTTRSQPSAPPASRQSGPGAFGRSGGAASPSAASAPSAANAPRGSSALSRDMEQSAAKANALRTLDARRAAAQQPLPPLNDTAMRPQQPAPGGGYQQPGNQPGYQQPGYQPGYQQPMHGPVIVQQPSSGLMHGIMGFMLGRAMTSHPTVIYTGNGNGGNNGNNGNNNGGGNGNNNGGANNGNGDATTASGQWDGSTPTGAAATVATPAPVAPSFAASVLRLFAWMVLLSGLAWLVVYVVRKWRRLRAGNATNYSFERN